MHDAPQSAAPMNGAPRPALFGKLPDRGDFVARGVPRALQRPFEAWLAAVTEGARATLGEGLAGVWAAAPVWRFWIGPGLMAGHVVTGALLPSADRVGRRYPLAVFLAGAPGGPGACLPPVLSAPDRDWHAACADLLRAARDGALLDQVEAALAALRLPAGAGQDGGLPVALSADPRGALWAQTADGTAAALWEDIRAADHCIAAAGRSYWWSGGRVLALRGLPEPDGFAWMLQQPVLPEPAVPAVLPDSPPAVTSNDEPATEEGASPFDAGEADTRATGPSAAAEALAVERSPDGSADAPVTQRAVSDAPDPATEAVEQAPPETTAEDGETEEAAAHGRRDGGGDRAEAG